MAKRGQSEFVQWMPYILEALRKLGGSATPREVYAEVATLANVSDEKRFAKLKSGSLRFPNQVAWARQYLVWEGLVSSPKHGIWMLTPEGKAATLDSEQAQQIFRNAVFRGSKQATPDDKLVGEDPLATHQDYRGEVLTLLQSISPKAFERFCADLLRHLGMERVEEVGGSGDKGIDGIGYLPSGPIVTTKIAFQCKRYTGAISPSQIREFRGAIGHRAEKGIFFTTSYFTTAAQIEAGEDMAKPIELVDGDRLVDLLAQHEFGLTEAKTYDVDHDFLANYTTDSTSTKSTKD